MAEFAKDLQPTGADYLNESKGIRNAPGLDLGSLFEGVGKTIEIHAKSVQNQQQNEIDQSIYDSYDTASDSRMLDTLASQDETSIFNGGQVPVGISQGLQGIRKLAAAKEAGKVGDIRFWSSMEAEAKKLRARFPGQREYIDKQIAQVTGGRPANEVRNAILERQNILAQERQSGADYERKYLDENAKYLPPGVADLYRKGDLKFTALQSLVESRKSDDYRIEGEKSRITLEAEQGRMEDRRNEQAATAAIDTYTKNFLTDTTLAAGTIGEVQAGAWLSGGDLIKKVQSDMAAGKVPTPEEQAQLRQNVAILRARFQQGLAGVLDGKSPGKKSFGDVLSSETRKKITDNAMKQFDVIDSMLTDQKYGYFEMGLNNIKAQQDANMAKFNQDNPVWAILGKLAEVDKNGTVWEQFQKSPEGAAAMNQATRSLSQVVTANTVVTPGKTVSKSIDDLNQASGGRADPKSVKSVIDTSIDILTKGNIADKRIHIENLFSDNADNLINKFKSVSDQSYIFNRMAAPEVTKAIEEATKEYPELRNLYTQWAITAWKAQQNNNISSVGMTQDGSANVDLTYDPTTMQFGVQRNPTKVGRNVVSQTLYGNNVDLWNLGAVSDAVTNLNQSISTLKPILAMNGLSDQQIDEEIRNIIGAKAYTLGRDGSENFTQKLIKAVGTAGAAMAQNVSDSMSGKPQTGGSPFANFLGSWGSPISERSLLDYIGQAEASGNYNAYSGNSKSKGDLSKLTVGEIKQLQRYMIRNPNQFPSSAIGKYQIIQNTLQMKLDELGIKDDVLFTPELQDRLGMSLLEGRGLKDYRAGKITKEQFSKSLSQEWASLPIPDGKSFYEGDGKNRALVEWEDFQKQF